MTDYKSLNLENRRILKSTSVLSLGTLISRVLGFIRDIILARFLGTAMRADAFFVAFRIPNLFRDLVGEGATNSAVVPVVSEYVVKKDRIELWNLLSVVLILSLMLLSVITLLGIILAPLIVRLIAPGFIAEPEKLQLTIQLTRLVFPYLILIGLTAYCMGILYTFRSFWSPAFSPCLLNVAVIISAVIAFRTMPEPVFGLAIGVLLGGVAQLLLQIKPMMAKGIKLLRPKTLVHPGAEKIGRLLLPRLLGSGVYQLNVFVDTFCASLASIVGSGGIAAIYYANRIIQFPMGVFSISLASALLPTISELAQQNNIEELKKTLTFSLENIFLIMLPISVYTMLLSTPIIQVLFERGEFNAYSTQITSWALMFYALGLVSFSGIKIMVTAFYAFQDTKTPVRAACLSLAVNVILNFVLIGPLKVGGIALASAISATINFLCLYYLMDKRLGGMSASMVRFIAKVLSACVLMVWAIVGTWHSLTDLGGISQLIMAAGIGSCVFTVACCVLKVSQVTEILTWLFKKIR